MHRFALLLIPVASAILACAQTITSPVSGSPDALSAEADATPPAPDASQPSPDGGPGAPDATCSPTCGARRCGVEPTCGTSCGDCPTATTCSLQGECLPSCSVGTSTCGVDGVSYQACGLDPNLGVPSLGPRVACGGGASCQPSTGQCTGGSCIPAQVLLVVDRSASIAANSTWTWVRDEVLHAVGAYQVDTAFGLRTFPDATCAPGAPLLPVRDARGALESALRAPTADASSPLADALAGLEPLFTGQDDGRAVVLLTDGDETCRSDANGSEAASALRRVGVRTFTIAIGGSANRALLDDIARAGGTDRARLATDAARLREALEAVLSEVSACRNPHARLGLGWYHSCALRPSGEAQCWGRPDDNRTRPPLGRHVDIDSSTDATCAAGADGRVRCWGRDEAGQLAAPPGSFVEVAGGNEHFCARQASGQVVCWGDDTDRQTQAPATPFTQVTATGFGSCGLLADGTMDCWGQMAPMTGTWQRVDGGSFHLCGIRTDGTLGCSGGRQTPPGTYSRVAAGYETDCAVATDGHLVCWGSDVYSLVSGVPAGRYVDVDINYQTACAVREDDAVICWGYDGEGMAQPPR